MHGMLNSHRDMIQGASKAREDIRAVGSDIQVDQTVLQAGDMLGPAEIGILATVGAATLKVMSWQLHTSVNLFLQTISCCIVLLALLSKAAFACCKVHKATFCCSSLRGL